MRQKSPTSGGVPPAHDPYVSLRERNFRFFLCGNALSTVGMQMLSLAVSWELYNTTHSKTVLGLVSIIQVVPFLFLAIPTGHLADLFNRKFIILIDQLLLTFSAATLGFASLGRGSIPDWPVVHWVNSLLSGLAGYFHETGCDFTARHVPFMLGLLLVNAVIRTVNQPAKQAFLPQLVPAKAFPNAVMWNAAMYQNSVIAGMMLGGLILAWLQSHASTRASSYAAVYFITAACQLAQWIFFLPIQSLPAAPVREPITLRSLNAGIRFVWHTDVILAAITLDLFGVLFGGATALLPVFAKDILGCGVLGLGFLRAAPSVGAAIVPVLLAYLPPIKNSGRALLITVAGFGFATIGFGLSKSFYLSLACLFFVGFCDIISAIIRNTLVQMLTPDDLRGRVTAVKSVFSTSSNQLGEAESCFIALLFGPVVSVVSGGLGTILVVAAVAAAWPRLRKVGALHDCQAPAEPQSVQEPIRNVA